MAVGFVNGAAAGLPGEVHSTKLNDLGTIRMRADGNEYIYLEGVASVVDGDWVYYKPGTFAAVRLVAGIKGSVPVAIATAAVVAATYGWFLIAGADSAANANSTAVSNLHIFTTATAGVVDDAIVKNEQIKGVFATGAGVAGGTIPVVISRPYVGSYDESA